MSLIVFWKEQNLIQYGENFVDWKTKKCITSLPDHIKSLEIKEEQGEKNQVLNHEKSQQIKVFLLKNL